MDIGDFERLFAGEPQLIERGVEKQLAIDLAVGDLDALVTTAQNLMRRFPDTAAPAVESVLGALQAQAGALEGADLVKLAQDLSAQAPSAQLLRTAVATRALAAIVRQRAESVGLTGRDLLLYTLDLARAARQAGDAKAAIGLLQPLREQFPTNADVIDELAESLYAVGVSTGDSDMLARQAAPLYDALITGVAPKADRSRPPLWWNAWMKRLLIMHVTGEFADQIAPRIRGLRLSVDPSLGPAPYNAVLAALEKAHAP